MEAFGFCPTLCSSRKNRCQVKIRKSSLSLTNRYVARHEPIKTCLFWSFMAITNKLMCAMIRRVVGHVRYTQDECAACRKFLRPFFTPKIADTPSSTAACVHHTYKVQYVNPFTIYTHMDIEAGTVISLGQHSSSPRRSPELPVLAAISATFDFLAVVK